MMAVVLELELFLPGLASLKEKRRILRSIKEGLAPRYGAVVAEVAAHDRYQRALLGAALVGGRPTEVRQRAQDFLVALEARGDVILGRVARVEVDPTSWAA